MRGDAAAWALSPPTDSCGPGMEEPHPKGNELFSVKSQPLTQFLFGASADRFLSFCPLALQLTNSHRDATC